MDSRPVMRGGGHLEAIKAGPRPPAVIKLRPDLGAPEPRRLAAAAFTSLCPSARPLSHASNPNRYFAHLCNTRSKLIKINPTPASAWSCFGHGCIDSVFWSPRTRVVTQTLTMAVIVGGLGEALRSITRAADRAATQQGAAGARQPHPEHPGRRPAALAVHTRV